MTIFDMVPLFLRRLLCRKSMLYIFFIIASPVYFSFACVKTNMKNFTIYSYVINIIANIPSTNPRIIKKHKTYYKVVMCFVAARKIFFSCLVTVSLLLVVSPLEKCAALLYQIHSQKFLLFLLCVL